MPESDGSWYAVRCVFEWSGTPTRAYEERVTLWRAQSFEDAIAQAEEEAEDYAASDRDEPYCYLGMAQAFWLFDEPGHGAEVFSLLRDSELGHDDYLDRFFESGGEHQGNHVPASLFARVRARLTRRPRGSSR